MAGESGHVCDIITNKKGSPRPQNIPAQPLAFLALIADYCDGVMFDFLGVQVNAHYARL